VRRCKPRESPSFTEGEDVNAEKPEYHSVSALGAGRFANRFCEDASRYLIAKGDKDPSLELNFLLDPLWPVYWEDGMAAAIAEINNIKNSGKPQ